MLKRGSTGAEVKAWQTFLRLQGFSAVQADGDFGPATEAATQAWQAARGLPADGIVGPDSLRASSAPTRSAAPASSAPATTRLSSAGRTLIKGFEGLSLTAYRDADGYSIGYGHYGAKAGQTITRSEADLFFDLDVARFETAVSRATPRAEPHQFDAMTSLAYNIGAEAFTRSTVARRHNADDVTGAADAFLLWNQSRGKVLPVLERRRERERQIYLHGYAGAPSSPPPPPSSAPSASRLPVVLLALAGVAVLWFRR